MFFRKKKEKTVQTEEASEYKRGYNDGYSHGLSKTESNISAFSGVFSKISPIFVSLLNILVSSYNNYYKQQKYFNTISAPRQRGKRIFDM